MYVVCVSVCDACMSVYGMSMSVCGVCKCAVTEVCVQYAWCLYE